MISSFVWMLICFLLIIIKHVFLKPVEDKKLFAMYEARDNVDLAAIEGKISQNSEEYKYVINQINFEIYYMKNNYDFTIPFRNLFVRPEKLKTYFEEKYQLIEKYDVLVNSYTISNSYFRKSLRFRIKFFISLVVKPYYYILCAIITLLELNEKVTNISAQFIESLKNRMIIVKDINTEYRNFNREYLKKA